VPPARPIPLIFPNNLVYPFILLSALFLMHLIIDRQLIQVQAIFSLPEQSIKQLFLPHFMPPCHLAYVEWFSPFSANLEPNHLMYKVSRTIRDGQRIASVIPIQGIQRSTHLFPKFDPSLLSTWTSDNVLENCNTFFVNPWSDRHTYITIC
jgi:hypothetical protein